MLVVPSEGGRLCSGIARRELLRVGGAGFLGLTLPRLLQTQAAAAEPAARPPAGAAARPPKTFGAAKSVVVVYLQGGPSQLDLWDPKEHCPDKVRSPFETISSKVPGMETTNLLPKLGRMLDRVTLLRSMSYSPQGLFNHTAAMYQTLTGYTADKVSPAGQLEPPSTKDFPNFGSNIVRLRPVEAAMLPFVMLPRPLQESNVIDKAGTAGFLGKAYDPFPLFPPGDDSDMQKMDRIQLGDLKLRADVSPDRLRRRARLRDVLDAGMPDLEKAVAKLELDQHYRKALDLVLSGKAREAFDLKREKDPLRDAYGRNTFGQSCLLARRLIEAGTRVVEVIWPKQANSDQHSLDVHVGLNKRMKDLIAPMLDAGLAALIRDLDERGLLAETLVVAMGEFGRSPQKGVSTSGNTNSDDGRDHWPYCYTVLAAGAGVGRGKVYGKSDATASAPLEHPVHPSDLLATIYHAVGIPPGTLVNNHLNQPRELVKGNVVEGLFG